MMIPPLLAMREDKQIVPYPLMDRFVCKCCLRIYLHSAWGSIRIPAWGSIPRLLISNLLKQVENGILNLLQQIWVLI